MSVDVKNHRESRMKIKFPISTISDCKLPFEERCGVFFARSLEDVKRITSNYQGASIKNFMLYAYVVIHVFTANTILRVIKFLLFKTRVVHQGVHHLVVYTVGILGDTVAVLPALAALRNRYPKANITVINNCQTWSSQAAFELLINSPAVDRLIIVKDLDCPVQRRGWRFSIDVPELLKISCDLFVNLSPFGNRGWLGAVLREMILGYLLGAKYVVGFRVATYNRRGIFNTVQHRFVKNEPRRARKVLIQLKLSPVEKKDLLPNSSDSKKVVLNKIIERGGDIRSFFIINPGAKFKAQCWPPERFGVVANYIAKRYHASIVVTGTSSERKIADKVVKASGGTSINLAGETTIQELIELLRSAKGCVTNDTGTMHLAAMVGVPTVAVFSTRHSPTHWTPLGSNVVSLFTFPDCIYCYNDFCEIPVCLTNIGVDEVIQAIEQVLEAA